MFLVMMKFLAWKVWCSTQKESSSSTRFNSCTVAGSSCSGSSSVVLDSSGAGNGHGRHSVIPARKFRPTLAVIELLRFVIEKLNVADVLRYIFYIFMVV